MDASLTNIEEGFYVDPDTRKTFFVKKADKITLVPPWVKSKPSDWKKIGAKKK